MRRLGRPPSARSAPERGAVAVLVAVLVSGVLFVVGALTVDLGSAWTARLGLHELAETAALAGAAVLPTDPQRLAPAAADAAEDDAVDAAARALCTGPGRPPAWQPQCTGTGWATDGDEDNGEIDVVDSEQDYADLDAGELPPRVLRVRTPPVRVEFGLARIAGFDHLDVRSAASARRGLPYPADRRLAVAPFTLTLDDLRSPDYQGICLRITDRPTATDWDPPPAPTPDPATVDPLVPGSGDPWLRVGTLDDDVVPSQAPTPLRLRGATAGPLQGTVVDPARVTVLVGAADAAHTATTTAVTLVPGDPADPADDTYDIEFTTPDLSSDPAYGGPVPVWFVLTDGGTDHVSEATSVTYPAPPGPPALDCDPADEGRGLVDLAREDGRQGPGAATVDDVRLGLDTQVQVFGSWPVAQPTPDADTDCYEPSVTGDVQPSSPPPAGTWVPAVNCVRLAPGSSVSEADLTAGWLTEGPAPGRLRTHCTGDTGTIGGVPGTLDATNPFRAANGLMAPGVNATSLRERVRDGLAANAGLRGAFRERIYDCPRLLLVPVLDTSVPPAGPDGAAGTYPVVGLTYFYVYDVGRFGVPRAARGLVRQSDGTLVGIRGWVIDPAYVRGGDWIEHLEAPDDALPVAVPRKAVLVRAPGDDHPDTGP